MPNTEKIIEKLKKLSSPESIAGMERYGIKVEKALGISMPVLRKLAKEIGKNDKIALELWDSEIHEARILASIIFKPENLNEKLMEEWVNCFKSWDLCDQVCMNLFEKHPLAWQKAIEWTTREDEFVKRAGFALMARLAVSNKKATDDQFFYFFSFIKKESTDERNYVKKAVNWALRQIGKRNLNLNAKSIKLAKEIKEIDSKSAKWIASDAIRELESEEVQKRLRRKK